MIECPKCRSLSADDAEVCTLCFQKFKSKAPPPASQDYIFAPAAVIDYDTWKIHGHALVTEKGLHVFVDKWTNTDIPESAAGSAVKEGFGKLGLAGMIIGHVAGNMIDQKMHDSTWEGINEPHPPQLYFEYVGVATEREFRDVFKGWPGLSKCKKFFSVPKRDFKSVSFDSRLTVEAQYFTLGVASKNWPAKDKIARFLLSKSFPYK